MTATAAFLRNYLVVTGQVVAAVVQAWLHSSGDTDRGPQRTLLVEHAGYRGHGSARAGSRLQRQRSSKAGVPADACGLTTSGPAAGQRLT